MFNIEILFKKFFLVSRTWKILTTRREKTNICLRLALKSESLILKKIVLFVPMKAIGVVLVSFMLTLNMFHIFVLVFLLLTLSR